MKKLIFALSMCVIGGAAHAVCPGNFTEAHMDNMVITGIGESCPAGMVEYYEIDSICNAHIY